MPAAARVGDAITHTSAFVDLVEGALLGAALGAILVASGGTAAPLVIAAAAAGGASLGGTVGKLWGQHQAAPAGKIVAGSKDVFINGKPAAFYTSLTACDQHSGPRAVAEGSSTVFINGRPAARTGDHGSCGFVVGPGSPDVVIGGAPVAPRGYAGEVPWQADAALLLLGLAGGEAALAVKGLGAAAIAARLGMGLVGGTAGGGVAHYVGAKFLPEGSVGLEVVTFAGALVGGGLGYRGAAAAEGLAGGRVTGGGLIGPAESRYTGARTIDVRRVDAWDRAEAGYDVIRGQTEDVGAVARNTTWPEYRVQRVKDHVFFRDHQLDDGVRRFDADPEMHNAWVRLTEGEHTPEDVRLLEHEYFESRFEALFRTDYRTAHTATIRSGRTWP